MKSILALSAFAATALAREYSPMVEDAWYGYSAYSHDGWWGAGVLGHADIAAGGEWPWWSDNEYMVNQINLYAKGYFNLEAWIQLAIFKIHLTGEFIAAEIDYASIFLCRCLCSFLCGPLCSSDSVVNCLILFMHVCRE